jgi:hypothetical protein
MGVSPYVNEPDPRARGTCRSLKPYDRTRAKHCRIGWPSQLNAAEMHKEFANSDGPSASSLRREQFGIGIERR